MHNLFSTMCVKWDDSKLACPVNSFSSPAQETELGNVCKPIVQCTTGHCTGLYDNTGIEISFANGPSRLQQPRR